MMIEPHPPAPVPILCGGESEAALRRAARLCDGWVGYAYAWDDAVGYAQRSTHCGASTDGSRSRSKSCWRFSSRRRSISTGGPRTRHHRGDVQAVAGQETGSGGVESYREPIERFAETIIEKCR